MAPRFFAPDAHARGSIVALPEDEAEHLTRVLRLGAGDVVRVFNGRGAEFIARIVAARKTRASVELTEAATPAPEARVAVTLAAAVLKGDKMDDVIRDAVMLGVAAIQPLVSERTETTRTALARGRRVARWQRVAVSSAKQCGRAVVPAVAEPLTFADAQTVRAAGTRVMLVEPAAGVAMTGLEQLKAANDVELIVGPEGGWTETEVRQAAAAGAMLLTLGSLTLRADAMAIVALSALRAVCEWTRVSR